MSLKILCELCPTECELDNYQMGRCKVRINREGVLYSLVYGKPCSVALDPIEKKPLFHFFPSSRTFSLATAGCVLGCKFCNKWQISQARPEEVDFTDLTPDDVVRRALSYGCGSIAYADTEPTAFYEYMYDTSAIAKESGIRNVMHSCGYIHERPLRRLCGHLDAVNVDLKAFTEDFYGSICGGRLRPVLDSLITMRQEDVWLEITNLIIPTLNDNVLMIREMCRWIVKNLGPDVPIHFPRFFPHYKLKDLPPASYETLKMAHDEALDTGMRYVYIGDLRSDAENTYCPKCKKMIIEREGHEVKRNNTRKGRCRFCWTSIPGIWS